MKRDNDIGDHVTWRVGGAGGWQSGHNIIIGMSQSHSPDDIPRIPGINRMLIIWLDAHPHYLLPVSWGSWNLTSCSGDVLTVKLEWRVTGGWHHHLWLTDHSCPAGQCPSWVRKSVKMNSCLITKVFIRNQHPLLFVIHSAVCFKHCQEF